MPRSNAVSLPSSTTTTWNRRKKYSDILTTPIRNPATGLGKEASTVHKLYRIVLSEHHYPIIR